MDSYPYPYLYKSTGEWNLHLDCIAPGVTGEQADQFSSRGTQRNWVLTRVCRFMSQVLQMKCDRRRMELLEAAAHEEQKCHTQIVLIDGG